MDLFAAQPQTLVHDAEGGIRYWPDVIDADTAEAWFDALRQKVPWRSERRPMYDRVVDVPRQLASYALPRWPPDLPLPDMLAVVQRLVPAPYSAVGLNLYRDGRDSVAMHNDKLHQIAPGQPISLLSLGHPRRMLVRAKAPGARALPVELAPGSLLAMSHASQLTHEHGIPKTSRPVGPRISVVFRVRPAGWTPD
jgi:alkylated DNA repair dioxygenase AlkB